MHIFLLKTTIISYSSILFKLLFENKKKGKDFCNSGFEDDLWSAYQMSFSEKLTFQNAPSPQEFNEGDDADIICDVISSPPPSIIWKYKKTRIQPETDGKKYTTRSLSIHTLVFPVKNHVWVLLWAHCDDTELFLRELKVWCCFYLHCFVCRVKPHLDETILTSEGSSLRDRWKKRWPQFSNSQATFHCKTTNCSGAWKPNCSMLITHFPHFSC